MKKFLNCTLLCLGLTVVYLSVIVFIGVFFFNGNPTVGQPFHSTPWKIFTALILAPLFETYIFVFVGWIVVNPKVTPKERLTKFVVSCGLFILMHAFSGVHRMILIIFPTLVQGYVYFYLGRSRTESYWLCVWAHFIHNGFSLATLMFLMRFKSLS